MSERLNSRRPSDFLYFSCPISSSLTLKLLTVQLVPILCSFIESFLSAKIAEMNF